jgi:DNA-directed RNA polymerase specialized sigma24 family protein
MKLEEVIPSNSALSFADVLTFEDLLARHAREFERQADVLAHRIYLGLTETEIAQVLGVSTATVNRDLRDAKEWLKGQWNSDQ